MLSHPAVLAALGAVLESPILQAFENAVDTVVTKMRPFVRNRNQCLANIIEALADCGAFLQVSTVFALRESDRSSNVASVAAPREISLRTGLDNSQA